MRRLAAAAAIVASFGCSSGETDPTSKPADASYDAKYRCSIDSGYAGDSQCLTPPDPSEGYQLHYGPARYDDPAALEPFLLEPGAEVTDCHYLTTPNDVEVFSGEYHARARPGTHHLIVWAGTPPDLPPDGTLRECTFDAGMAFQLGAQSGLSSDGVELDVPLPDAPPPPENTGLATRITSHMRIAFQMHYVNTTSEPLLREGWVNMHYTSRESVREIVDPIFFIGGLSMNIQPGTRELVQPAPCALPENGPDELRILGVSAHMHAHGKRFSVYKIAADGQRSLLYQTFDWEEPLTAQFDSTHSYPAPSATSEGAESGIVTIKKGEQIAWECDIDNDGTTALKFGNEAYDAEMCNLFGFYAPSFGGAWGCVDI